jgi:hypothetical protein
MMIDFALQAERNEGKAPRDAIFEACKLRFRPIMMTTMSAILGALPLMIGWGEGSELRHPLGITMVGGLIFSQALTLFTTPVIATHSTGWRDAQERAQTLRRSTRRGIAMNLSLRSSIAQSRPPAPHRRCRARGRHRVHAAAGVAAAASRLPDDFGAGEPARGQSRHDGGDGRDAA